MSVGTLMRDAKFGAGTSARIDISDGGAANVFKSD
jgi:hypothetical protein